MIVEEAIEQSGFSESRVSLIRRWITRKIRRDLSVDRLPVGIGQDSVAFVRNMFLLMRNVAAQMMVPTRGGFLLSENIGEEVVARSAKTIFGPVDMPLSAILSTSVLTLVSYRTDTADSRIRFVFKAFQEFFTAEFALHEAIPVDRLPLEVRSFVDEMSQGTTMA